VSFAGAIESVNRLKPTTQEADNIFSAGTFA